MATLRRLAFALTFSFLATNISQAQTWINTDSGGTYSWNTGSNWSGGTVPDQQKAIAVFSAAGAGGEKTVTVDTSVTIQELHVNSNQVGALTMEGQLLKFKNVGSGGNPIQLTTDAPLTINNNLEFSGSASKPVVFDVASAAVMTLNGTLTNTNGAINAYYDVKGGGTLVMSGVNRGFVGIINVLDAGTTLVVNKDLGSPITLAAGTNFVANSDFATRDQTIGTLTALTGSTINYNSLVGGTPASPTNDLLTVTNTLTLDPTSPLNITLKDDGTLVMGESYTITVIDAASIVGLGTLQPQNPPSIHVFADGFVFATTPTVLVDSLNGTVQITFTPVPVPEPATTLGVAALGGGAFWLLRRKRRKVQTA